MADEPIPLYDGEPSGARIIHEDEQRGGGNVQTVHSKRQGARRECDRIHVCFSPDDPTAPAEHVECPVLNISANGIAIDFDRALNVGAAGTVCYMTVSHRPVHVTCSVRYCGSLGGGRYRLGLKLDRHLDVEERRPAKCVPGRDVFPKLRPRKLRPMKSDEDSHE